MQGLSNELTKQVKTANKFMLEILNKLSVKFESGNYHLKNDKELIDYRNRIEEKHDKTLESITNIIGKVELFSLTKGFFKL